jgi:glycosyltransferase involved in cell wall biosynthesis
MLQMDLFVLPTLFPFESLPTVIIEALSCRLPVIATWVGEIEKMLSAGPAGEKAGMLVDLGANEYNHSRLAEK